MDHRPVFTITLFGITLQPNALQAVFLIIFALAAIQGCGQPERHPKQLDVADNLAPAPAKPAPAPIPPPPPIAVEKAPDRFRIESEGYFNAGHQNNEREILIITDQKTGHQYIGITGVGVTELVQQGKVKTEE